VEIGYGVPAAGGRAAAIPDAADGPHGL